MKKELHISHIYCAQSFYPHAKEAPKWYWGCPCKAAAGPFNTYEEARKDEWNHTTRR